MKAVILICLLIGSPLLLRGQVLLETQQGDIVTFAPNAVTSSLFGVLNANDQSLSVRFLYGLPNPVGVLPKKYFSFGLKAKPTNGIASLISDGKLSAGANISAAFTKIDLFTCGGKYLDFVTINTSYEAFKYDLFKADTLFKSQIYSKRFKGFNLGLSYNLLVKGAHLFVVSMGYSRKNNISSLKLIDITDQTASYDSSGVNRTLSNKLSARKGTYKEFDRYPIRVSYTYVPPDGGVGVKPGWSLYLKRDSSEDKRIMDLGVLLFFTTSKIGSRMPVVGINLQADDFSDVQRRNNGLLNRLSLGLTSVFPIIE